MIPAECHPTIVHGVATSAIDNTAFSSVFLIKKMLMKVRCTEMMKLFSYLFVISLRNATTEIKNKIDVKIKTKN